jgi:hypothetical protein
MLGVGGIVERAGNIHMAWRVFVVAIVHYAHGKWGNLSSVSKRKVINKNLVEEGLI